MAIISGSIHLYTQDSILDFPQALNMEKNTIYRKIGLECMTCHNFFSFYPGSENIKMFPVVLIVKDVMVQGNMYRIFNLEFVDTSKFFDYSIVKPANLSIEQNELCSRCHVQKFCFKV